MTDEIIARLKHLKYRDSIGNDRLRAQVWAKTDRGDMPRPVADVSPYRVICGFRENATGKTCPGELGQAHAYGAARPFPVEFSAGAAAHLENGQAPERGQWYVYHPKRLQRQGDGSYRVFARSKKPDPRGWRVDEDGRPVGRRPLPGGLAHGRPRLTDAPAKDMVGNLPMLPAVIVCPVCGRRNVVAAPPKLRGRVETPVGTFRLPD